MTQNERDLLIKDLSARLPYGVKVQTVDEDIELLIGIDMPNYYSTNATFYTFDDYPIKPCLFPLSSMTEEQLKEYMTVPSGHPTIDWFNKNHIDYRCLIERGLAIDATGLNIY